MMLWRPLVALTLFLQLPAAAQTAAALARAVREAGLDREECYRVRDIVLSKDDIRIYLTDGHLIFSKPVGGRRVAAFFAADVEGGDAEVMLLPPNKAERQSLAAFIDAPNLDEHFRNAAFIFTGDDYDSIVAQFARNPANRKAPEIGAVLDEEWSPVLHNLASSYQTRLVYDLLAGPGRRGSLFAGMFNGVKLGNFDVIFDPTSSEQVLAGQVASRGNLLFFNTWTSFPSRASRNHPGPRNEDLELSDYRIEATVNPDLSMAAVTRVKVKPAADNVKVTAFDIAGAMEVGQVTVDGRPAEVLQREALRVNVSRGGNSMFVVVPPEPLQAGRQYEFVFHHSGNAILNAGDRVFYVSARGNWYPLHGLQFSTYDLLFRYPRDLELVTPGDMAEDRTDGEWRITRRRTQSPIRLAAFNLGNYAHARSDRGGYVVDVCANRALEAALRPKTAQLQLPSQLPPPRRRVQNDSLAALEAAQAPDPLARLQSLASEASAALQFMASRFGPPALPHVTVSPIPGTFGQGFPGLIYLSTMAYLKNPPDPQASTSHAEQLFFTDVLQAHEIAHQWWGNRITAASYRDHWLMESLANYSALVYMEKAHGARTLETLLDDYRNGLLARNEAGQMVESSGPIALGYRLENSQQPRAWRAITYGKGSWIMQMLRRRMGDERFFSMLAEVLKRYDRKEIGSEDFRAVAAQFLPPKTEDPKLEAFFDQWVYGTGIPSFKLSWSVKGKLPNLKLVGTLTQSDVDGDFSVPVPVEIQVARGRTVTEWVQSGASPATFTVALKQPPLKVTLDPHYAVLRR
jgi:hypothetical protein